jgi:hypothetical protein
MQISCDAYDLHKVKWWEDNSKLYNAYGKNAKLQNFNQIQTNANNIQY